MKMMFASLPVCLISVFLLAQRGSTSEPEFSSFKHQPAGNDDVGLTEEPDVQVKPDPNTERYDFSTLSEPVGVSPQEAQYLSDFLVKLMRGVWGGELPEDNLESELDEMFSQTGKSDDLVSNERAISPLFRRTNADELNDEVNDDVRRSRLVGLFKRAPMSLLFRRSNMPTLFKRNPLSSSLFKRSNLVSLFKRKANDVTF
uniref:Uncharacterized protein LOC100178695 n=1 Tax=Phallusia mammillata TaxID=59560 RepID=A0A6F9DHS4_9ASCI|nr:uncharacterized protein LOC100178695 [Phallusia mammillata]